MDNYQAIAYAVLALKIKGYTVDQMLEIKSAMKLMMDLNSEIEAELKAERILMEN